VHCRDVGAPDAASWESSLAQTLGSTGIWQRAFSANPLEQRSFYELTAADKVRQQLLIPAVVITAPCMLRMKDTAQQSPALHNTLSGCAIAMQQLTSEMLSNAVAVML
jgi:hypothetical protein